VVCIDHTKTLVAIEGYYVAISSNMAGAAATLTNLHLIKLVGHRPSQVIIFVVFLNPSEKIPE
jgi:hypothetical protein